MNEATTRDLIVMDPHTLIWTIQLIERVYPGWWWSISQKHNDVRFSMGPTPNCPHPLDVKYAKTPDGDNGFHPFMSRLAKTSFDTTKTHRLDDRDVINFRQTILTMVNELRGFEKNSQVHFPTIPVSPQYRRQSLGDLAKLSAVYSFLLKTTIPLIKSSDLKLEEIYIGSCDLSADCSLRGIKPDGSSFDYSCDLAENGIIGEAMSEAMDELLEDLDLKKG